MLAVKQRHSCAAWGPLVARQSLPLSITHEQPAAWPPHPSPQAKHAEAVAAYEQRLAGLEEARAQLEAAVAERDAAAEGLRGEAEELRGTIAGLQAQLGECGLWGLWVGLGECVKQYAVE